MYLPAKFHSGNSFDEAFSILEKALMDSSVLGSGKIDCPLLLLGLMYREVSRAMEVEDGVPSMAPIHLKTSRFGFNEVRRIENLLDQVSLPSE